MAAITTHSIRQTSSFNQKPSFGAVDGGRPRFKTGAIFLGATADNGDTATVDVFAEFGIQRILFVVGFIHTTANSVVVEEAPVTAYDSTNLTITVGGATANKTRFYVVYGT